MSTQITSTQHVFILPTFVLFLRNWILKYNIIPDVVETTFVTMLWIAEIQSKSRLMYQKLWRISLTNYEQQFNWYELHIVPQSLPNSSNYLLFMHCANEIHEAIDKCLDFIRIETYTGIIHKNELVEAPSTLWSLLVCFSVPFSSYLPMFTINMEILVPEVESYLGFMGEMA